MNFIKKNMVWIILGSVMLCVTGGLVFMIIKSGGESKVQLDKLDEVRARIIGVRNYEYKLNPENVQQAKENAEVAQKALAELAESLNTRYPKPEIEDSPTPIMMRTKMESEFKRLHVYLTQKGITCGIKYFGLQEFMDTEELVNEEKIPHILQQFIIIDHIINVVQKSKISELAGFTRLTDLKLEKQADLFDYCTYEIKVVGDSSAVREFVNSIYNSEAFFLIRDMQIEPKAGETESRIGAGSSDGETGGSLQDDKYKRVIFRSLTKIEMTLTLDYIVFSEVK
jgi:hypothetical protein